MWDELQQQRVAMAGAMAQCQALQERVDAAGVPASPSKIAHSPPSP